MNVIAAGKVIAHFYLREYFKGTAPKTGISILWGHQTFQLEQLWFGLQCIFNQASIMAIEPFPSGTCFFAPLFLKPLLISPRKMRIGTVTPDIFQEMKTGKY